MPVVYLHAVVRHFPTFALGSFNWCRMQKVPVPFAFRKSRSSLVQIVGNSFIVLLHQELAPQCSPRPIEQTYRLLHFNFIGNKLQYATKLLHFDSNAQVHKFPESAYWTTVLCMRSSLNFLPDHFVNCTENCLEKWQN